MINSISSVAASTSVKPATAAAAAAEAPAAKRANPVDLLEQLAKKYDIRSMTPREIDELAEQLPTDTKDQMEAKMILLTRGAEFQEHLAETVAQATGQPFGPEQRAALAERMDTKIDVIEQFETLLEMNRRHGGPTESTEKMLSFLHVFEARGHLPEGGLRV